MSAQGKASIRLEQGAYIRMTASIVGKKEGEGPLGAGFDEVEQDAFFGKENWEQAESELQKRVVELVLKKACVDRRRVRYLFAGDLLGQLIATSFGVGGFDIPLVGLYGACSTMGESLALGAMTVNAGYADQVLCLTSSHYASAEKEFRFPLDYGNQRPESTTWTVTGAGAALVGNTPTNVRIAGVTIGKIVDYGVKDVMNMGAAMAPAAAATISRNLLDFGVDADYYDRIITGDLGKVGREALIELLRQKQIDISERHLDCGIEIFAAEEQDTHAGGSGCGCSAAVFCSEIYNRIRSGEWKRVLFVPTGALLSKTSSQEGAAIPGIAHAVALEYV